MRSLLKSFASDERGAVVVLFSLALIPMLGVTGLGVDYALALRADAKLQEAADAAALAAVITRVPTVTQRQQAALAAFSANAPAGVQATATPGSITSRQATVTATGQVPTSFMQVLRISTTGIGASATAVKVFDGPPPCIIALNTNANKAISITGSSSYTANNCTIHSNSSALNALSIDNNATVSGAGFCAVGETAVPNKLEHLARDYCEPIEDPLAGLTKPVTGTCLGNGLEISPKQATTLWPGTYCNGLILKGTVTLKPGVYVIRGLLTITSQAKINGDGVTFFLTGTSAGFTVDAQGLVNVKAPTSGPYSGILFFQDRSANAGFTNTLTGGSSSTMLGTIYTPSQTVRVAGSSNLAQGPAFLPIVAGKVEITGSVSATAASSTMPLPFPLPQTESGVRLLN